MKALPLWQPWASLVAMGAKRVETRAFPPTRLGLHPGQRIAIHATKGGLGQAGELEWLTANAAAFRLLASELLAGFGTIGTIVDALPRGAVVATCILSRATEITAAGAAELERTNPNEHAFGDYTAGRWAWVLRDVHKLAAPIPFTGRQGTFDVPDELLTGSATADRPRQGVLL